MRFPYDLIFFSISLLIFSRCIHYISQIVEEERKEHNQIKFLNPVSVKIWSIFIGTLYYEEAHKDTRGTWLLILTKNLMNYYFLMVQNSIVRKAAAVPIVVYPLNAKKCAMKFVDVVTFYLCSHYSNLNHSVNC